MLNFLIGVAGVVVLFAGWLAVQALVRRHDPGVGDDDVLACRMCADGSCYCGLKALRAWKSKHGKG